MRSYGSFCPVSKASEVFAERWTPMIVVELLSGSRRFNEIEVGVPGIPKAVLAQRLRSLEAAGVITRRKEEGRRVEYHLTPAGEDLRPVVMALGEWGQRWVNSDVSQSDVEPSLLMWDMHRRIHLDRLPDKRVVVQFDFTGIRQKRFWLVLEKDEPSVCYFDPGFEIDLFVTADTLALHRVWMGRVSLDECLRSSSITVDGSRELARAFPSWLALNTFAGVAAVR
jgi:DNA-binding HxlR family transcriptional regulator